MAVCANRSASGALGGASVERPSPSPRRLAASRLFAAGCGYDFIVS